MIKLNQLLDLSRVNVMGILNVTPDSFSDGGQFDSVEAAFQQAEQMVADGVDIIDIGGESTRPGAEPVSVEQELARVIPVIERVSQLGKPISIDTSKPEVMQAAVKAGACILNDVYGFRLPGAASMAGELQVPVCIMHMQGEPRTMQASPEYEDVCEEVTRFLTQRAAELEFCGVERSNIMIDPGFGFGKTLAHNCELLQHLDKLKSAGFPILAGLSRKSMLGQILDKPVEQRLFGSIATATIAATKGARIVRVHDVKETVDAIKVVNQLNEF